MMVLLDRIDAFLRARRMTPTRFGREAVGDAKFVLQLRAGREPRSRTVQRVIAYLERNDDYDAASEPDRGENPSSTLVDDRRTV